MQIIGFNFEKISAERKKTSESKINASVNININSITEEKNTPIKDKKVLRFEFEFQVDFKPDFANINLTGSILTTAEKKEITEILKEWKSKKIPQNTRAPLFNTILTKCNLRALQLEEELNLPMHLPIGLPPPQSKNNTNYAG